MCPPRSRPGPQLARRRDPSPRRERLGSKRLRWRAARRPGSPFGARPLESECGWLDRGWTLLFPLLLENSENDRGLRHGRVTCGDQARTSWGSWDGKATIARPFGVSEGPREVRENPWSW